MNSHSHRHFPQIMAALADDSTHRTAATSGVSSGLRVVLQGRSVLSAVLISGIASGLIPAGSFAFVLAGTVMADGSYITYQRVRQ
ncbi:hypothetical protein [Streptomyces sp. NPDC047046]|uniref:hypothetical protein n=1 Tax=Streptomyces sp. NPDC047046 TaxID=3155378 RepID=UPI00340D3A7E